MRRDVVQAGGGDRLPEASTEAAVALLPGFGVLLSAREDKRLRIVRHRDEVLTYRRDDERWDQQSGQNGMPRLLSVRSWRAKQTSLTPCSQVEMSRRAWQGSARQSHSLRLAQVWCLTRRVCTVPNDGAVKVGNTAGWWDTCSGTPLPPTSPARTTWWASRL
jgi:hypothetical protein